MKRHPVLPLLCALTLAVHGPAAMLTCGGELNLWVNGQATAWAWAQSKPI